MSFYLRTSVKVGPVRVKMSRRGLGASVGVPGFRAGAGPRGTYVSLGGGLASYRATARPNRGSAPKTAPVVHRADPFAGIPSPGDVVLSDVSGATTIEMTEVGSSELVTQLNDAARSPSFWPWCLVLTLALMFLSPWVIFVGAPVTVWLYWKDRIRKTVVAFYDVQGAEAARFQQLVDSFGQACAAQRAWHVIASGAVASTHQHKINAGASSLVKRLPLARSTGGPRHLSSNIAVPSLTTSRRSVYLLPDRVLVRDGKHYADIAYETLRAEATLQRFIEDGPVSADSVVLGHTWQYVNVKGGPDRRFKNNRKLPVLQYGRLTMTGEGGYSAIFDFSTSRASAALAESLGAMATALDVPLSATAHAHPRVSVPPSPSIEHKRFLGDGAKPAGPTTSEHARPAALSRRRLSAQGRVAVVGESHYQPALHRAAGGTSAGTDFEQHLPVVAALILEPDNPHDPCAVRVDVVTSRAPGTSTAKPTFSSPRDRSRSPGKRTTSRRSRATTKSIRPGPS